MSRRDTIIIALLINAGLLALLFMLAVNTDEDRTEERAAPVQTVAESKTPIVENTPAPAVVSNAAIVDEVDNFLKELPQEEPIYVDDEGVVELEKTKPVAIVQQAASTPDSKEEDEPRYVEVTVKRGDALEKIARSNGTTVEAIKKANNLTTAKLSIGQVLKVPATKKNSSSEKAIVKESAPATSNKVADAAKEVVKKPSTGNGDPQYYTVKSGDSPWKIAKQYKVDFETLLKLNGLDEDKAKNMKVGDKIRVR